MKIEISVPVWKKNKKIWKSWRKSAKNWSEQLEADFKEEW